MHSILIQLDEQTYQLLERVAPAAKRQRAQFVRQALLKAAMDAEEVRTRAAYMALPDSEAEADDWSTAEEFRAPGMRQPPLTVSGRALRRAGKAGGSQAGEQRR